jgi:HlyD family secretion protein
VDVRRILQWLAGRYATTVEAGINTRLAVMAALALVVLVLAFGLFHSGDAGSSSRLPPRFTAGATDGQVGALGRIEPESEIIEVGGPADERLASLLVKEGDTVAKGQVLGYFSSHEQRAAEAQAAAATVHDAQVRVQRTAELYPLRVRAQEAKIRSIEAEFVNNRDILKSRMQTREYQTRRAIDDQAALVRQNEESLKSEREELDRLKSEMHFEKLSADVALQKAKADLLRAQAQEHEVTLVAPIDGTILKILTRVGGRVGDSPVLNMGDTRRMHAVAEVYETDIGRVKLGQRALVTSPALPAPLTGRVVKIGHMIFKNDVLGTDPAARIDARIVEVRILLDDSKKAARLTNLSVDVVIQADDAKPEAKPDGSAQQADRS